jgi:hypothetical protein
MLLILRRGRILKPSPAAYDFGAVVAQPLMKRRRGNPNWGNPIPVPALLTEFEKQVRQMGLTKCEYAASVELKRWCERNRNRLYVPEWLLKEWEMGVEPTFTGAA